MSESNPIELSPVEARVLAVLVEKMHTVPDTYPLSINALLAGCNQKTSRDPVMEVSDAEVHAALESLRRRSLVIESSGGRVMRADGHAHAARSADCRRIAGQLRKAAPFLGCFGG
jgi:uncharacterized protein YceH (UPF0502 family)